MDLSTQVPTAWVRRLLELTPPGVHGQLAQVNRAWRQQVESLSPVKQLQNGYEFLSYSTPYEIPGYVGTVGAEYETEGPSPFSQWKGAKVLDKHGLTLYVASGEELLKHDLRTNTVETIASIPFASTLTSLRLEGNSLFGLHETGHVSFWRLGEEAIGPTRWICNFDHTGTRSIQVWKAPSGSSPQFHRTIDVETYHQLFQYEIDGSPHVALLTYSSLRTYNAESGELRLNVEGFERYGTSASISPQLSMVNPNPDLILHSNKQVITTICLLDGTQKRFPVLIEATGWEDSSDDTTDRMHWLRTCHVAGLACIVTLQGYGDRSAKIAIWQAGDGKPLRNRDTNIHPKGHVQIAETSFGTWLLGIRSGRSRLAFTYPTGCDLILLDTMQLLRRVEFIYSPKIHSWIGSGIGPSGYPSWIVAHHGGRVSILAPTDSERAPSGDELILEVNARQVRRIHRQICYMRLRECRGITTAVCILGCMFAGLLAVLLRAPTEES